MERTREEIETYIQAQKNLQEFINKRKKDSGEKDGIPFIDFSFDTKEEVDEYVSLQKAIEDAAPHYTAEEIREASQEEKIRKNKNKKKQEELMRQFVQKHIDDEWKLTLSIGDKSVTMKIAAQNLDHLNKTFGIDAKGLILDTLFETALLSSYKEEEDKINYLKLKE